MVVLYLLVIFVKIVKTLKIRSKLGQNEVKTTEPINQPGRIRLSHAQAKIKIYSWLPPPMVVVPQILAFALLVFAEHRF